MKNKNLYDIPYHANFKIDKLSNIYILNDNNDIINQFSISDIKFIYNLETYYILELSNLVFYGIRDISKFKDPIFINDSEIKINDIIFKKIPNFLNGYYISDSGAVYSIFRNRLRKRNIDKDGYCRISFPFPHYTNIAIHRLVYKTWIGEIPENYVIDHIDNIKWNNNYHNLQAISSFENSRKAAEDGLYKSSIHWIKEMVIEACELMMKNMDIKDIAAKFNIFPENKTLYKNFRNQLYNFRVHKKSWVDITSQYDFTHYDGIKSLHLKFRDSEILEMRKLYQNGMCMKEIAKLFNANYNNHFRNLIHGITHKKLFT